MNIVEGLARQLVRVARMEHEYAEIGASGLFALNSMRIEIEQGCRALGSADPLAMVAAFRKLESFK